MAIRPAPGTVASKSSPSVYHAGAPPPPLYVAAPPAPPYAAAVAAAPPSAHHVPPSTYRIASSLAHHVPPPPTYEVTLYVGPDEQKIVVPASLLTKASTWFARANKKVFNLKGEDLQEMNLFLDFLEKGRYELPREDSTPTRNFHGARIGRAYSDLASRFAACRFHMHRRHVKMYMLGERFEVPGLRRYAFDRVFELLQDEDAAEIWKWEASDLFIEERLRLVMMVYRLAGKPLRKMFAFKAAETWSLYMECLDISREHHKRVALDDLMTVVPGFIRDVLMLLGDSRTTLLGLGKDGFFETVELQRYVWWWW